MTSVTVNIHNTRLFEESCFYRICYPRKAKWPREPRTRMHGWGVGAGGSTGEATSAATTQTLPTAQTVFATRGEVRARPLSAPPPETCVADQFPSYEFYRAPPPRGPCSRRAVVTTLFVVGLAAGWATADSVCPVGAAPGIHGPQPRARERLPRRRVEGERRASLIHRGKCQSCASVRRFVSERGQLGSKQARAQCLTRGRWATSRARRRRREEDN